MAQTKALTQVELGIDTLEKRGFDVLQNKRVGLLTHPAGLNRFGVSTVHILHQTRSVNLVALFGPEHGIYGDEEAGAKIGNRTDPRTGLPVYSLYGKYRKPTPEMLSGVECMVIDLQDIGCRSYTFISCMKLAMEACFENDVEVIILDRPNPLGGLKVDGPIIEKEFLSYVGAFQIPYVHGLTIGEIARMAASRPGMLDITEGERRNGRLSVVTMNGWRRFMSWPMTGLQWKATSPNIPDFPATAGYCMTGLGAQLGSFKHGIGSEYPFRILSIEGLTPLQLKTELESRNLPGLEFELKAFDQGGQTGVYVRIVDHSSWRPTELGFNMMQIAAQVSSQNPFALAKDSDVLFFNKIVGSRNWWREISQKGARANLAGYIGAWERQAKQFQLQSRQYWLYE
ncbi:DUF1343 domain-containing protein [Puniceicoccaceae bacterium K14]|nr:DUF1343 domain-containing protein [Puniceicoccaceae bacterium K14]